METLKVVRDDEDFERCYNLHRVAGKMVRIRGVFGRRLIAEIFSPALRWELLTMPTVRVLGHIEKDFDQMAVIVLNEVKLILDDGQMNARCICPLCNQGHDPKLIGDGGEGKDNIITRMVQEGEAIRCSRSGGIEWLTNSCEKTKTVNIVSRSSLGTCTHCVNGILRNLR